MALLDVVLDSLRAHEADLRRQGLLHVAVFGSVVRRESRVDSDVDLMVVLAPEAENNFLAYAGLAADL